MILDCWLLIKIYRSLDACRPAFFSIKSWRPKDKRWLVLMVVRRVTRIFLGRGVFSELGHFDKQNQLQQEKEIPRREKISRLFTWKHFVHFKWEFFPINDHNWDIFPQIRAPFSNFRRKAGETSPPHPL